MRIQTPSSRATFRVRYSPVDVCLAAFSPLLALYLRDAYILSHDGAVTAGIYCLVSLTCSLIAFSVFSLCDGMPRYFSARDGTEIVKAVLIGELMTCAVLFAFTRLEGVPRSTPVIHALLLGAGLISSRALARIAHRDRKSSDRRRLADEHVIIIGLNDLSFFYMKFLDAFACDQLRAIAALDRDPRSIGRSIHGVSVVGPPAHLQSIIEEFAVHGIHTDRVVVGGEADILSNEELLEIRRVCAEKGIDLQFVPRLFGLNPANASEQPARAAIQLPARASSTPSLALPYYFRLKRGIDFCAALVMIIALSPLCILVAALAFLDVGSPILFWQQRMGRGGRNFLLYKIRTLRPPFDRRGQPISEQSRLSWIGRLLRETRLDELPQLMNVLVGDMSMIGPRPLLPRDQPPTPAVRLMVRPGITGWAQVNGAARLSPEEKDAFDEWYIRNASLWLDLRVAGLTLSRLVDGSRRSGQTSARRCAARSVQEDREWSARLQRGLSRVSASILRPALKDESRPPAMHS